MNTTYVPPKQTCPHCGYCPHCGRANNRVVSKPREGYGWFGQDRWGRPGFAQKPLI